MADEAKKLDPELEKIRLEIWKQGIATTMHFTEMSARTRQIGLAFVVAALGLSITLLAQYRDARLPFVLFGYQYDLHISGVIILLSAVGLFAIMLLDLKVYHRMLRGSVAFTTELEQKGFRETHMLTERGLTESVSHYSRSAHGKTGGIKIASRSVTAERKIQRFYWVAIGSIAALGLTVIVFTSRMSEHQLVIEQTIRYEKQEVRPTDAKPGDRR